MSSSNVNSLSAGLQQLYNNDLLPSSLNASVLNSSSAGQLNQLASNSISRQQIGVLLGNGSGVSDTATLSTDASNALLQEINPSSTATATGSDPLTEAVNNALTSNLNAAVDRFLPQTQSSSGVVNLLA